MEGKHGLYHAFQILLGQSVKPGDIVFETRKEDEHDGPATYICSMRVPCFDESQSFESEPCTTEKLAQTSVCNQALKHWESEFEGAQVLHEEKKAAKKEEQKRKKEEENALKETADLEEAADPEEA